MVGSGIGSFLGGFGSSLGQSRLRNMMMQQGARQNPPPIGTGGADYSVPAGPLMQGGQFQSSPFSVMYSWLKPLIGG